MKNKIALLAVLTAVVFSSCRKDRYCECTTSTIYNANNVTSITKKDMYKKVTKKEIKTVCISYTEQFSDGTTVTVACRIE